MRDLQQHFFGQRSFVSIVLPPNERKILVHLSLRQLRSLDIDYVANLNRGANDRQAGLFDCPSNSGDEFGNFAIFAAPSLVSSLAADLRRALYFGLVHRPRDILSFAVL